MNKNEIREKVNKAHEILENVLGGAYGYVCDFDEGFLDLLRIGDDMAGKNHCRDEYRLFLQTGTFQENWRDGIQFLYGSVRSKQNHPHPAAGDLEYLPVWFEPAIPMETEYGTYPDPTYPVRQRVRLGSIFLD